MSATGLDAAAGSGDATAADKLLKRIGGQGLVLMSGFGTAQACAFLRNALLGHWLSQGDFGIAAAITLSLQLVETLSDIGPDRLIIQAPDGDAPQMQATAHSLLIARGALTGLLLYLAAAPLTAFFAIDEARWAFEAIAIVPLIKGLMHLDARRYQRRLQNRPFILCEVVPQIAALALAVPLLVWQHPPDYGVVVWLAWTQAAATVILSHSVAERRYQLALATNYVRRMIAFGWPIWLSALPLVAVYQGDRMIVGRLIGMEELAAYTAAFLITMVPGLLAARIGNALMLPLLSDAAASNPRQYRDRYETMFWVTSAFAATYLTGFLVSGGALLTLAFGPNYDNLGVVVGLLAAMWSIRMIQAVPGMALMAMADTRPLLWAGLIRALGLPFAALAILSGYGLAGAAASGAAAEFASLVYVVLRTNRHAELGVQSLAKSASLLACATIVGLCASAALHGQADIISILAGVVAAAAVAVAAVLGRLRNDESFAGMVLRRG